MCGVVAAVLSDCDCLVVLLQVVLLPLPGVGAGSLCAVAAATV